MFEHLAMLVENFPGATNQTRCFSHILNISAKSILRQFNAPKKANPDNLDDVGDAKKALTDLAQELKHEPAGLDDDKSGDEIEEGSDQEMDDNGDGLSDEEVAELEETLGLIRLMLAKCLRK